VFATELGTSLLDVQAGKPIQEIIQHRNTWPIALAPSGRHILVWQEGKGILWDIPAGKPGSVSFEDGKFIAGIFSPDSKKMAVIMDLSTGATQTSFKLKSLEFMHTATLSQKRKFLVGFEENNQEPHILARLLENLLPKETKQKGHVKVVDVA